MSKRKILMLTGPDYEDLELWYPKLRLEEAGFEVKTAGLGEASYKGKHGYPCPTDGSIEHFAAADFDGVFVPGGWAPDKLRRDPRVLDRVRAMAKDGKLIASICHGPWVLISAGVVRGKRMTSTVAIRDDLQNAGAEWVDRPAVRDGNMVTARVPSDLPEMMKLVLGFLDEEHRER